MCLVTVSPNALGIDGTQGAVKWLFLSSLLPGKVFGSAHCKNLIVDSKVIRVDGNRRSLTFFFAMEEFNGNG